MRNIKTIFYFSHYILLTKWCYEWFCALRYCECLDTHEGGSQKFILMLSIILVLQDKALVHSGRLSGGWHDMNLCILLSCSVIICLHGTSPAWRVSFFEKWDMSSRLALHSFAVDLPHSVHVLPLVLVLKNPVPYCILQRGPERNCVFILNLSLPLKHKGFMLHTWAAQNGFIIWMMLKMLILLCWTQVWNENRHKTLWDFFRCFEIAAQCWVKKRAHMYVLIPHQLSRTLLWP